MDRVRGLVMLAVGLCLLDRVELLPAFASATAGRAAPTLRGAAAGPDAGAQSPPPARAGQGFATAGAVLAIGAAGLTATRRASAGARKRVQVRADASYLVPGGPIAVYSKALTDAAAKVGESVPVTKDVMMIRRKYEDDAFLNELVLIQNEPGLDVLAKARRTIKLLEPFDSTVMSKFITFLAKKQRLMALKPILKEYVAELYYNQSIAPVLVKSAVPLTDEQLETLKEKMKAKTGTQDVKLITEIDGRLMAGLTLEWGYTDPEKMENPTNGIDLSLKSYLQKAAINEGVIAVLA